MWMWVGGGWGCPTHMCMCMDACACTHMHARTCMHGKHDNFMQMAAPIGGIPYDVICACMCVCAHTCACVCGAPSHHRPSPSTHSPIPQRGDPQNQSKFNSTWTDQDISILFKDLKSVETSPPMGGCMV